MSIGRKGRGWSSLLLVAAMAVIAPALALQGADPSLNEPYQAPDFERWRQRFESPGREVYDKRAEIVAALGIKPGMQVADVGAGTGLFTLLFADAVGPQGRVFAVDISPVFVQNIERRAREAGRRNVIGVINSQRDSGLKPQSADLVFISDTYHHFEAPQAMLASIHAALRPGGRLAVIDYERRPGESSAWIMDHVRTGKPGVVQELTHAGFVLVQEPKLLKENFFLIFEKTAAPHNADR